MINVMVHGFMGKMGRVICRLLNENPGFQIACGVDVNAADANESFPVFSNFSSVNVDVDVIVDFSTAVAIPHLLEYAAKTKSPVVLCTTGLDDKTLALVKNTSEAAPVFISANMSLGINLLAELLKKAAAALAPAGFDIEILEKHHNQKIDAPSGTAVLLGDAINESLDNKYHYVYDRQSKREKRDPYEIGMHSVRGGTLVGEHSVIFAGLDEVIEFKHMAHSKEVFGTGAVNAAKFLVGKVPGLYSMKDLLSEILG